MLKIDNNLLVELGLSGLPDVEKNSFLKHIYETLEMRVGIRLADQMSNEQLDEFEQYFEAKDDAGAFKWLEANFPNYKDIVQEEFDKLKAEVSQSAPQILAASQQAAAQAAVQPVMPQAPAPQMAPAEYAQQPAPAADGFTTPAPMPAVDPYVSAPVPMPQAPAATPDPGAFASQPAPMPQAQTWQQPAPQATPYDQAVPVQNPYQPAPQPTPASDPMSPPAPAMPFDPSQMPPTQAPTTQPPAGPGASPASF